MGFSDQIDRYRKRIDIVLAGRRLRGRTPEPPPAPFVCGVTRSGTTLLRLMLEQQLIDIEAGRPPGTGIDIRRLPRLERERLRAALLAVSRIDLVVRDALGR